MRPGDDPITTFAMLLGRLERLNDELVTGVCSRHGISPSEIRVLAMLREADGSVRPATLSRWVVQTAGGLTATLHRLEADGRITRTPDPDDGRGKLISSTPAGEVFHDHVLAEIADRYRLVLGDVDLERAGDQISALIDGFERLGDHPPSAAWGRSRSFTG